MYRSGGVRPLNIYFRKQIALLQAHPTLIKRPLIEHDNGELNVGWPVK
ncbi:MAG: hypothetical protein CSA45_06385 [Gammaproteobacteria bacterium]|nr:MAG: hypothetical protein CSA45_06385 [Gammaproteobacteria bacterium]